MQLHVKLVLDHLGLVAGLIDEIVIVQKIKELIG